MPDAFTIAKLLQYLELKLEPLAGKEGLERRVCSVQSNRPGLALCGYFDHFGHDRVQIFGNGEISYLQQLDSSERYVILTRFFSYEIPCLVITRSLTAPSEMIALSNKQRIPLLQTEHDSSTFTTLLLHFLENEFGPTEFVHGNLVDVYGLGVLILGQSGIGKSEASLELLRKGHRLIADDTVLLKKISEHRVFGIRPNPLKHYMEIRGLGIIDVVALFGTTAVGNRKQVELVVTLEQWNSARSYDRTGLESKPYQFHQESISHVVLPVAPGRNISNLIETAAANLWSKKLGINAPENLNRALTDMMNDEQKKDRVEEWQHQTFLFSHPQVLEVEKSQ